MPVRSRSRLALSEEADCNRLRPPFRRGVRDSSPRTPNGCHSSGDQSQPCKSQRRPCRPGSLCGSNRIGWKVVDLRLVDQQEKCVQSLCAGLGRRVGAIKIRFLYATLVKLLNALLRNNPQLEKVAELDGIRRTRLGACG